MIEIKFIDGPLAGTISMAKEGVLNKMQVFIFQERPYLKCKYKLNKDLTATFLNNVK